MIVRRFGRGWFRDGVLVGVAQRIQCCENCSGFKNFAHDYPVPSPKTGNVNTKGHRPTMISRQHSTSSAYSWAADFLAVICPQASKNQSHCLGTPVRLLTCLLKIWRVLPQTTVCIFVWELLIMVERSETCNDFCSRVLFTKVIAFLF